MAIDDVYGSRGLLAASAAAARAARYAGMRRYRRSSSLYAEQATFATMDETRCADDLRLQLRARLLAMRRRHARGRLASNEVGVLRRQSCMPRH